MRNLKIKIKNPGPILILILLVTGICSLAYAAAIQVSVRINGIKPYPGDPMSATPRIEVMLTSTNTIQSGRITIDSSISNLNFVQAGNNYYATHEVTTPLADGIHGITIEAFDVSGEAVTFEVAPLYVRAAADAIVQGFPLNYPNPFDPGIQSTRIGYILSKPANIKLHIFDLAGNLIAKQSYAADGEGGRAGYNEVSWDGKSDGGDYVGNGIYIYLMIVDGKVAQNGKGKITVFKR